MEFQQLRYFLKIHECRSFTGAAKALGLSQSALSLSIKDLEATLEAQVFLRGPGGIELTDVGDGLLGYATAILHQREKALADISQIQSQQSRAITIGVNSAFSRRIWDDVLALFYKRSPGVTVRVSFSAHPLETVVEKLERNTWDAAISLDPDGVLDGSTTGISHQDIVSSTSQIYARPEHEIHALPSVSLHDLQRFEWAVGTTVTSIRMFRALHDEEGHARDPRVALYADSFDIIMGAVGCSDLLCFAPNRLIEASGSSLKAVQQDVVAPVVSDWKLMYCDNLQLSAPSKVFVSCVRKIVSKMAT